MMQRMQLKQEFLLRYNLVSCALLVHLVLPLAYDQLKLENEQRLHRHQQELDHHLCLDHLAHGKKNNLQQKELNLYQPKFLRYQFLQQLE